MITKIQTILEGKADADVSSYSINGRSLTKLSYQELVDARDYYRKEYITERRTEDARNGNRSSQTILVRF